MPRNNRYNPPPAEREAQRRAATGRGQPDSDQLRPDSSWRLVSSDDFEAQFRRSPWDRRIYDEAMAEAEIGEFSGVQFVQSPRIRGTQAATEAALHDSTADTWMYWGATATEARMRREAAERQLRDIERYNHIEQAVDRIQAGFSRVSGPVGFQSSYPVTLKRRNRQPDGSLLDLTQPAEATL